MSIDTKKIHTVKTDFRGTSLLAIATMLFVVWILIGGKSNPSISNLWEFIMKYIGFTAYVLIPMVVFAIASLALRCIESFRHGSAWVQVLQGIEVTSPVCGLLGSFVGIGLALKSLDSFTEDAISSMISQIGTCIWSTVIGISVGILAYVIVEYGVPQKLSNGKSL